MNEPNVEHGAGLSPPKPAVRPEAQPQGHVCTAACTHEGAHVAAATPNTGNEDVIMGSPERGLGRHPVPKDAVHKYT
jgi:hypothetical protein